MSLVTRRLRRLTRSWTLVVVAGVVVGLLVAPYVFVMAAGSSGTVAVVPISGGIDGTSAAEVTSMLVEARNDPSIDAVVLVSNSPGGGAAASERLYLEVARTAEELPVVASVDAMAASGAYYAVVPADHVYAKPSSLVGSVGVFTLAPTQLQPIDLVIASGPSKLSGGTDREWAYKIESLQRAFVGAVYENRGSELTISRAELSKGGLFTGSQAVERGMADEIGGMSAAVEEAAERAGLDDYSVEVLREDDRTVEFLSRANYVASDATDKRMISPAEFVGTLGEDPATPNVVMLPPSVIAATAQDVVRPDEANRTATGVGA